VRGEKGPKAGRFTRSLLEFHFLLANLSIQRLSF
jgi:hypothetical protein